MAVATLIGIKVTSSLVVVNLGATLIIVDLGGTLIVVDLGATLIIVDLGGTAHEGVTVTLIALGKSNGNRDQGSKRNKELHVDFSRRIIRSRPT
jgi:hypothetical protein